MPTPFSRLFLTDAGISEKRYPAFLMDILLMTACSPRTEESTLESQPLVRQAISSHPKQVDQIGKTFPFLFSFIAYLTIQSAFLVHKLLILMASPPPGKSTPLSLGSRLSKQLMFLVKEKMGTTCAPDIWRNFTYEAAMYEQLPAPANYNFGQSLESD